MVERKGLREQTRVADLVPAAAREEPHELTLDRLLALRGLSLQPAERVERALGIDDRLDARRPQGSDELSLQVWLAHEHRVGQALEHHGL